MKQNEMREALEAPEHNLRNLLAIIHRDGGHYASENGLDKATEDAITIVYGYRTWMDLAQYAMNQTLKEFPKHYDYTEEVATSTN